MFQSPISASGSPSCCAEPRLRDVRERRQPLELVRVVRVVELAPVRHVEAPEAHAVTDRDGHRARLERQGAVGERLAEAGHAGEVELHVLEADPARERDAVPLREPVRGDLVARVLEGLQRELGVLALDLLHGEHIDVRPLQPVRDAADPRPDRVDVPGGDPHGMQRYPSRRGVPLRRGGPMSVQHEAVRAFLAVTGRGPAVAVRGGARPRASRAGRVARRRRRSRSGGVVGRGLAGRRLAGRPARAAAGLRHRASRCTAALRVRAGGAALDAVADRSPPRAAARSSRRSTGSRPRAPPRRPCRTSRRSSGALAEDGPGRAARRLRRRRDGARRRAAARRRGAAAAPAAQRPVARRRR